MKKGRKNQVILDDIGYSLKLAVITSSILIVIETLSLMMNGLEYFEAGTIIFKLMIIFLGTLLMGLCNFVISRGNDAKDNIKIFINTIILKVKENIGVSFAVLALSLLFSATFEYAMETFLILYIFFILYKANEEYQTKRNKKIKKANIIIQVVINLLLFLFIVKLMNEIVSSETINCLYLIIYGVSIFLIAIISSIINQTK